MDGVALKISVDSLPAIQRLRAVASKVIDTVPLLKIAGEVMRDSIEQTFSEEGVPAGSWRRLHMSSIATAYSQGGQKRKKAFVKRTGMATKGFLSFATKKKILQGAGLLKNSITYRPASSLEGVAQLVIGSNLIYARIHQLGGVIRPKIKKALRFPIMTAAGVQWVTKRSVTIPARPYLVIRPEDQRNLTEAVEDFLTNP